MRGWVRSALALAAVVAAGQAWAQGTTTPGTDGASTRDNITLVIAIIGAITGVLGFGLSAFNTWSAAQTKRLRVLVKPEDIEIRGDNERSFVIDVVNMSAFHVTVAEIGFMVGPKGHRFPIRAASSRQGEQLPQRLDPRESVGIHVYPYRILPLGADLRKAYARLASGEIVTGSSAALDELRVEMTPSKR